MFFMNLNIKDEFEIDFFAGLFNFLCATYIHDFSDVFLSFATRWVNFMLAKEDALNPETNGLFDKTSADFVKQGN